MRPARPSAAVRHRQGWRRQDDGRRRARRARPPAAASARWCARWTPRARWPPRSTSAPLEFEPHRGRRRTCSAMAMNTEDSLREYLRLFVQHPAASAASARWPARSTSSPTPRPGVKEILAVGKLCYEVRERHYDLVVVDAEATGHIVAQIGAPRVIRELVQVGLVRDQTQWMIDILEDPARTGRGRGHDARGDAGHRDDRAARPARRTRPASTSPRSSPTGCCRRCSTDARPRCSTASARPAAGSCWSRPPGPSVRHGARRGPADRGPPPRRRPATSSGCAPALAAGLPVLVRARAVHPGHRPPRGRRSSPRRSPTSSTSD